MRLTFSTKQMYDTDQIDSMLSMYETLLVGRKCLKEVDDGQVLGEDYEFKADILAYEAFNVSQRNGLISTASGGRLIEEVRGLIRKLYPKIASNAQKMQFWNPD
ncbi:MAG: hypothetical protein WC796_02200 [Candidatus Pacearchaeota archaeon]|jgi:hypothetical protein